MYRKVDPKNIAYTVHSKHIMPATIVFGIATLCRSTGFLMLIIVGLTYIKKLVAKSDRFFKIYKYLFYTFCSLLIMVLPIGVVMFWKPYIMHCETKLDRTNAVP